MIRYWYAIGRSLALAALLMGLVSSAANQNSDDLEHGFKEPPDSAKPRVWWHWMNGNVTKEGITLDLEWMKRVGIGGIQMFDANLNVPQYVDNRVVYRSPEWKDALRHAAAECDRLGLEMTMHISAGWSETGGPWVQPEQAMKKVVWSETRLRGPRRFTGTLPQPPSVNGRFQNISRAPQTAPPDPIFYADSAVLAFRLPEAEEPMVSLHPKVTSSAGELDVQALMDGHLAKTVAVPIPNDGTPAWIQFEFAQPFRSYAFSIAAAARGSEAAIPNGEVQASQDGAKFVTLASLPGQSHSSLNVRTYAYRETTARFYRVLFTPVPPASAGPRQYDIAEMEFHSGPRVNRWEDKAAYGNLFEADSLATPIVPAASAIPHHTIINLTSKVGKDGSLDWEVPSGNWLILRMGYSLTGQKNHPAPPEATGFEVDKLSRKHVESFLRGDVEPIAETLGPFFGESFRYFLLDSWEAGVENWTDDMVSEFRTRRGYDPIPFLPVLTGRVIDSADASDRFLWDFRRTIADLLAENHYGTVSEFLHKRGIQVYGEAMGVGLPTTGDGLQDKGRVDIPMGEFWTIVPGEGLRPQYTGDVHETASAAHIYGKTLAAAESFTSRPQVPLWAQSPYDLKALADHYMASGINRIVFHTSPHQPFADRKPGFTLGPYGLSYTRNITWAEQAKPWNTYLARNSYMLQQGLFVADLAYYYGEGAPITVPYWKSVHPAPPPGYNYDYINTEVLLTRMSVKDGRLTLPDGMSYRVLVLPEDVSRLTLPVLRKIRDLTAAGATIIAPRPISSPSLTGYPSADDEISAIANEVWGAIDGNSISEHAYGKGKVYWGRPIEDVLAALKTAPDFQYNRPQVDSQLDWIHRRLNNADIYFIANQRERAEDFQTTFRVDGKQPEFWYPDTGLTESAAYEIQNGRTNVPIHLDPYGSVFVVFRHATFAKSRTLVRSVNKALGRAKGPWQLTFPPNLGAPPQIRMDALSSWTTNENEGIKYFSGTAVYTTQLTAPPEWFRSGGKLMLDLGKVREIAEVSLNGKPLGILWKPPFAADVTGILKPGTNHLEVKVTNLWPNRIIGDAQPEAKKRYTFTLLKPYAKDSPLLESGLLGPVTVSGVSKK